MQGINLVPQGRQIFTSLRAEENLKVALTGREGGWTEEKAFELFPVLKERKNQRGGSMSGGEQQMLAIGRALMTNPSLLLMDEPTEGLSSLLVQLVGKVILELHNSGIAILLVEQKLGVAIKYSGFIHILNKGRIVASLSPAELGTNEEIRSRYLGVYAIRMMGA
ncbi:MAG: hypothetical protein A2156_05025 [Deltaproteobacteria bacterium RBG_16_48_10]|nr:MAG: hypothetical protein A2156_05025 [Deltaproteobacteria bacterium RBG_16_48_10]